MALGVQLDGAGRVRLDASGRVILANSGDPCCCGGGGGGDPCLCHTREVPACPGGATAYECETPQYEADIDASGSTVSTIDVGMWNIATADAPGLFIGIAGPEFVPDPPPEGGILLDVSWNLNANVSSTCVGGSRVLRSSGTFTYTINYYSYDPGPGTWDNRLYSNTITWTDQPATNVYNDRADASKGFPNAGYNYADAILNTIRGLFPAVTASVSDCTEAYTDGSLAIANDRFPMFNISNQLVGLDFLPDSGLAAISTGSGSGSNDCDGSQQAAVLNWTFFGYEPTGGVDEFDPIAAGGATQQYEWSILFSNQSECAEGALGGL